ncbi:WXG100 family type VII secretion target [Streptomyces sp. 8N706]|uniref:WXG100 family type VII secretion target n=1 Tax=Streptomyces sp. 8N706 TaxID=3457416 RepID=UPI003FD1B9D1
MTREGNSQALRDASAGWREMGRHLEDIVGALDHGVGTARATHWRGPAADAFGEDWRRLKKTVDEALPVFQLAAANLDDAAERMEVNSATGESHRSDGSDSSGSVAPDSYQASAPAAYQAGFALVALSQLGAALGATFGGGQGGHAGGSRGRGGRGATLPPSAPDGTSTARRPADPFGPPEVSAPPKERPRGGLGIARGVRTGARRPDAAASDGPARERAKPDQAEAAQKPGSATAPRSAPSPGSGTGTRPGAAPAPGQVPAPGAEPGSGAQPGSGGRVTAGDGGGRIREPQAQWEPHQQPEPEPEPKAGPDATRHGAFG